MVEYTPMIERMRDVGTITQQNTYLDEWNG
jgi:hypothetical protein